MTADCSDDWLHFSQLHNDWPDHVITSQPHGATIASRSSTPLAALIPEYEMPVWNVKSFRRKTGNQQHRVFSCFFWLWHLAADLCKGQAWGCVTGTVTRKRMSGPGLDLRWRQGVFSLPDLWRPALGPTQPTSKLTADPSAGKVAGAWRRPPPHSIYHRS